MQIFSFSKIGYLPTRFACRGIRSNLVWVIWIFTERKKKKKIHLQFHHQNAPLRNRCRIPHPPQPSHQGSKPGKENPGQDRFRTGFFYFSEWTGSLVDWVKGAIAPDQIEVMWQACLPEAPEKNKMLFNLSVPSWCIVLGCTCYYLLYLKWQFWTRYWT